MSISFREVTLGPLKQFSASAPDAAVIGIAGDNGSGKTSLLRAAAGLDRPVSGRVEPSGAVRLIEASDPPDYSPVAVLALLHSMARQDAAARLRAAIELEKLRRAGSTVLLVSHEEELLRTLADEIWWLDQGRLAGRGDPREILAGYRKHVAAKVRSWGEHSTALLKPSLRRGDGRAELLQIETLGEMGHPTMVWRSGELAVVRVTVRFHKDVADPVVGIMIRTRIGFEVYGTNTELERVALGPRKAGDTIRVVFGFRCELCPQEYTLTAASHDPDGVWHDWLEDALAFSVADTRYTAGVANLRAGVQMEKL